MRMAQVTQLFRAERPFVTGRGNRTVTFAWVVARDHGDVGTAAAFVWDHAGQVPMNAVLLIEEGAFKRGFTGVITEVAPVEQFGLATVFRYAVTGVPVAVQQFD